MNLCHLVKVMSLEQIVKLSQILIRTIPELRTITELDYSCTVNAAKNSTFANATIANLVAKHNIPHVLTFHACYSPSSKIFTCQKKFLQRLKEETLGYICTTLPSKQNLGTK